MTTLHENTALRNRFHAFTDRPAAGRIVADMLAPAYKGASDALVLAIPMGGVPVALEIKTRLGCPLDLAIVRKIQIPGNSEAGFGAVTGDGDILLNEPLVARKGKAARTVVAVPTAPQRTIDAFCSDSEKSKSRRCCDLNSNIRNDAP